MRWKGLGVEGVEFIVGSFECIGSFLLLILRKGGF